MKRLTLTTAAVLGAALIAGPVAAADLSAGANAAFLKSNAKRTGVVVLPGIQYRVIRSGTGPQPGRHDCVTVTYKGALIDGTVFDQTKDGESATFPVNGVIGGWVEVLQLMRAGDDWEVTIPSGLAYGSAGAGDGAIPADQTLVFEIGLQKVFAPPAGGCG